MKPIAAKDERLTRAREGQSFSERDGRIHVVRAKCDTGKEGRWYCVTHRQPFDNQFVIGKAGDQQQRDEQRARVPKREPRADRHVRTSIT